MMKLELEKVQKSFDVDMDSWKCKNEPKGAGSTCKIYFLENMERTRCTLLLHIHPKGIINYPLIESFSFQTDSNDEYEKVSVVITFS
jgi:hypothetical protein